ncbi:MAG: GTP-binding protein [Treponema sp.]|jgi:hypothetical protein|nr:GTP-binding protein [Treponema sp.]
MSGKLKEGMIMLEETIAQLKVYMGRFEKKGMQTDELYLEWQKQVIRMRGIITLSGAVMPRIFQGAYHDT